MKRPLMHEKIILYFGDKSDYLTKPDKSLNPDNRESLEQLCEQLEIPSLITTQQVHETTVYEVTKAEKGIFMIPTEADIIVTKQKNIGLGIFTADCVPLLLYDPEKEVIAAVHAGWRGSVAGIAAHAVDYLIEHHAIKPENVRIFIGPSIKVCCYDVGQDIIDAVQETNHERLTLYEWENRTVCDLVQLNIQFLRSRGCLLRNINRRENICTHCSPEYNSFRRDGEKAGRQISIISLI